MAAPCRHTDLKPDKDILEQTPLIALIGPTAVGKTALVLELAARLDAEVVSVDSMQVYRHMDIGTAKPTAAERGAIRHHLLDLVAPDEEYNVGRFIADAERACREIASRRRLPLLSGGTGLYLKGFQEGLFGADATTAAEAPAVAEIRNRLKLALAEQGRAALHARLGRIDPPTAARIHPNDTSRLLRALEVYELTGCPWSELLTRQQNDKNRASGRKKILKIGLSGERDWLYERINRRAGQMLESGLIAEVRHLLELGFGRELKPMQAIGYRHVLDHLEQQRSLAETMAELAKDTRHYAKRQLTWFQRDPEIRWFRPDQAPDILRLIAGYLEEFR